MWFRFQPSPIVHCNTNAQVQTCQLAIESPFDFKSCAMVLRRVLTVDWMRRYPTLGNTPDSQIQIRESDIDWSITADRQRIARFPIRKSSICLRRSCRESSTRSSKSDWRNRELVTMARKGELSQSINKDCFLQNLSVNWGICFATKVGHCLIGICGFQSWENSQIQFCECFHDGGEVIFNLNKKHHQNFLGQKYVFFLMTCFPTMMSLEMFLEDKPIDLFSFGQEKVSSKQVVKSNGWLFRSCCVETTNFVRNWKKSVSEDDQRKDRNYHPDVNSVQSRLLAQSQNPMRSPSSTQKTRP